MIRMPVFFGDKWVENMVPTAYLPIDVFPRFFAVGSSSGPEKLEKEN
jgi:hypothetical protein